MGEDLADVVAAAKEDGKDRVAGRALERAVRQAAVGIFESIEEVQQIATDWLWSYNRERRT